MLRFHFGRSQLILLFFVALVGLIGLNLIWLVPTIRNVRSSASILALEVAERVSVDISSSFENALKELVKAAEEIASEPERNTLVLSRLLKHDPAFRSVALVNREGRETVRLDRYELVTEKNLLDHAKSTHFYTALQGVPNLSTEILISPEFEPQAILAVPINVKGVIGEVLIAQFNIRNLVLALRRFRLQEGHIYVVDREGNQVMHPDLTELLRRPNFNNRSIVQKVIVDRMVADGLAPEDLYINERGEKVFAVGVPIPITGWGLFVEQPRSSALAGERQAWTFAVVTMLIGAILFVIILQSNARLARLLRELDRERLEKTEIIENLSDGVIFTDEKGAIRLLNRKAREILYVSGEIVGRTVLAEDKKNSALGLLPSILFPPDVPEGIFRSPKMGREFHFVEPMDLYLEADAIVLKRNKEEKDSSTIIIIRDVTRERILTRLKSEFISIAAHQLRTPISAIKWTLRLLLDGDLGPVNSGQSDYMQAAYETNERMIKLVNDLLNVSRIEEGRFEYVFAAEDLTALIEATVWSFQEIAGNKNITITFEKTPHPPPPIFMDRGKMHMVLQNLIENAISYTPSGGRVIVTLAEGKENLEVHIRDTGIGIALQDRAKLFTKFFRSEGAIKMAPSGSGLGLFIARNIILRHGGSIAVESEIGKGSTFRLTLPKKQAFGVSSKTVEFGELIKEF